MNTLEIKYTGKIKNWNDFKKYAKIQFVNYEKLEGRDWKKYDFSIDCAEDQMLFKDMLQIRCIEELTEAFVAFQEKDYEHFKEEITDALNFFISSMVMIDYDMKEISIQENSTSEEKFDELIFSHLCVLFYGIVQKIGFLCNLLKNRPWAQSNYLVSITDFNERLDNLWKYFWGVINFLGFSKNEIYELFERKYEVNKWRIKTGY